MTDPHAADTSVHESDIAIVGMSCRFPGASTPEAFWRRLLGGEDFLEDLSDDRLLAAGVPAESLRNPAYVRRASVLSGVEEFDAEFFAYSAREASLIDPQQRVFLELCLEALERAGVDPERSGDAVGVFAGSALASYLLNQLLPARRLLADDEEPTIMIGNNKDHLATRAAWSLGLRGPAINAQSACSTSLTAVHLACQSLLAGECDLALAGGVSIEIPQGRGYLYRPGMVLSEDGRCRPFDHRASGTVPGNGAGVVLLKPAEAALRDGDPITALIRSTAINNDGGAKMAYTAPSVEGQTEVIREALAVAEIDPASVGYVETHGTGTPLGDPIEIAALREAYEDAPLSLGSVKGNLGHCDAAAGLK
ncbi:MAG: polyketide synthase, partial [Acidobacteriota bacterium]